MATTLITLILCYFINLFAVFLTSNILSKFHLRKYRPGIWLLPLVILYVVTLDYLTGGINELTTDLTENLRIILKIILIVPYLLMLYLGSKSHFILRFYKVAV